MLYIRWPTFICFTCWGGLTTSFNGDVDEAVVGEGVVPGEGAFCTAVNDLLTPFSRVVIRWPEGKLIVTFFGFWTAVTRFFMLSCRLQVTIDINNARKTCFKLFTNRFRCLSAMNIEPLTAATAATPPTAPPAIAPIPLDEL